MLATQGLMRIKARALRRKVWFKVTSRVERGIVNLVIRCVEKIRSPVLTRAMSEIVTKILKALGNCFSKLAERAGATMAGKVCKIASAWGNRTASKWKHDHDFVMFLGVNAVNAQANPI